MEDKIGSLIDALQDLVKKLDARTTAEGVTDQRMAGENGFFDPLAQEKEKNEELADEITKKQKDIDEKAAKKTKKEQIARDKKSRTPRKILQKVTSVNVVDISDKALKKLARIVPKAKLKKKLEGEEGEKKGPWDFLKKLGIGILAVVVGPIVALVTAFQTIANQKWFLGLKKFVTESKFWGAIKSFAGTIKGFFGGLGAKFPVLGKIFGKVGGVLGKVLGTVKSVGGTIFNLIQKTKIYTVASKIGKFIGKIFAPIIILWGAIKTVMGAIKGYKEDGIAGAIKGGINALFDFMVGDLVKLIVAIPTWILEKIGLKNMAGALTKGVDGILQSFKDMVGGLVDTIVGVFTFDKERILKGMKAQMNGAVDLAGWILGMTIDPAINFLKDIFKWGDPDVPFSFKEDVVDPAWKSVKDWFKKILSFGDTADGGWSLLKFVNTIEHKIKDFFIGIFTWGITAGTNEQGEWNLGTFIGTVFENVKGWLIGVFSWVDLSVVWSLKDKVIETWNSVKEWFTNLISWAESDITDGVEDGFITNSIKGVIMTIKTWFSKLFTFDSTSSTITSMINITTWLPNLIVTGLGKISEWFLRLFGFDEQAGAVKEWNEKFSIGDLVVTAVEKVWEWFTSKFPNAAEFLKKSWNTLTGGIDSFGDFIWSGVKDVWSWLKKLWDSPKKVIEDGWNRAASNVSSIGDWIWSKIKDVWSWFEGLWSDASESLERGWNQTTAGVTDVGSWISSNITNAWSWFEGLWIDTKKSLIDGWNNLTGSVSDVGSWIWSKIKNVWSWFEGLWSGASESLKKSWNSLTQGVTNVGEWVGEKIASTWTSLTSLFKTGDISRLVPDGLKDIGSYVWSKVSVVWDGIKNIFDKIVNFDVKGYLKAKIKSTGGVVGEKVYEALFGDEDRLSAAKALETKKTATKLQEYGIAPELAETITKRRADVDKMYGGDNFAEGSEDFTEAVARLVGKGDKLTKSQERSVLQAFRKGGFGFKDTKLAKQVGDVSDMSDTKALNLIKSKLKALKEDEVWGADQVNDKYDEDLRLLGLASQTQNMSEKKSLATTDRIKTHLKSVGSIDLAGSNYKFDGSSNVTEESIKHLEKIYTDQSATSKSLTESLRKMGVTPDRLRQQMEEQQKSLPSTNFELESTSRIPELNTDAAAMDINQAGDALNAGTKKIKEATGDQFPIPSSPHAWEYIRMAGENINSGSKALYEQSVQYEKSGKNIGNDQSKETKKLSDRLDKMVDLMSETQQVQKKTLNVLEQNGLIDKQGDTIVNNGGNSTTVNNITTESGIMSFRDSVVGRLLNKNKY